MLMQRKTRQTEGADLATPQTHGRAIGKSLAECSGWMGRPFFLLTLSDPRTPSLSSSC